MIWGLIMPAWLRRTLAGLLAVALALLAAFGMGKRKAKRDAMTKAIEEQIKTRKEINDAIESSHAGGGAWLDRLHKRDK